MEKGETITNRELLQTFGIHDVLVCCGAFKGGEYVYNICAYLGAPSSTLKLEIAFTTSCVDYREACEKWLDSEAEWNDGVLKQAETSKGYAERCWKSREIIYKISK